MARGDELERTIDAKIERLRTRLKTAPIDANVKALLLGILDLLGDELWSKPYRQSAHSRLHSRH